MRCTGAVSTEIELANATQHQPKSPPIGEQPGSWLKGAEAPSFSPFGQPVRAFALSLIIDDQAISIYHIKPTGAAPNWNRRLYPWQ